MLRKTNMLSCIALATALAAGSVTAAEMAPTDVMDPPTFNNYHQAIYAAWKCQGANLYQNSAYNQDWNGPVAQEAQANQAKLAEIIDRQVDPDVLAGNLLSMIEQAKNEAHHLIEFNGCGSDGVQALLDLYDRELAPAL